MLKYNSFLNETTARRKRDTSKEKYNIYYYDKKLMEEMPWEKIRMEVQFDGLYRITVESTHQNKQQSWNDNQWNILMDREDNVYLSDDFVEKFKERFIKEFRANPIELRHYPKWLGNVQPYFKGKQFDL